MSDALRSRSRRHFLHATAALALPALPAFALEDRDHLQSQIEAIRQQHDVPALACLLMMDGNLTAQAYAGVRKYGNQLAVRVSDKFHLGSCTKAMTAHVCAQLVEQGKLHWDQPIVELLPNFAKTLSPAYRNLTLDHLLCQQTGFSGDSATRDFSLMQLHRLNGTAQHQREMYLCSVLAEAPVVQPGRQFIYSNRNFVLAGYLAERVAGQEWEKLMQTQLFEPLNMHSAGYGAMNTPGKIDQPWQHILQAGQHLAIDAGPLSDNPVALAPAGLVHMSLGHWASFAQDHLRGLRGEGGQLSKASYQHLHTPLSGGNYAGGWGVLQRDWGGGTVYTHTGSNTMNFCTIWLAPQKNLFVLVACNQGGENAAQACDAAATKTLRAVLKS